MTSVANFGSAEVTRNRLLNSSDSKGTCCPRSPTLRMARVSAPTAWMSMEGQSAGRGAAAHVEYEYAWLPSASVSRAHRTKAHAFSPFHVPYTTSWHPWSSPSENTGNGRPARPNASCSEYCKPCSWAKA